MLSTQINSGDGVPGNRAFVTTSWDDGDRKDLKLAELLASKGLPATFYITAGNVANRSAIAPSELCELSKAGFEIGAHTVTHPVLTEIDDATLRREVTQSKHLLQELLGQEVTSFAYPKGRYNAKVVARVSEAGYRCARGVRLLSVSSNFPFFEMPVTVQAFPHSPMNYVKNLIRRGQVVSLARNSLAIARAKSWVELGKALFDRVLQHGGVWHLVGHSWETEKLGDWAQLREMLDYVAGRTGVLYLTNGQLCEALRTDMSTANAPQGVLGAR